MRLRGGLLVCVVLMAAGCTRATTAPATTTTLPPADTCEELVDRVVDALQAYLDQFAGMSPEELTRFDPDRTELEERAEGLRARGRALGCQTDELDRLLAQRLDRLSAEGPVAETVLDGLRSELFADPDRRPPETLRVAPGDDLQAAISRVGPGSTIVLEAGEYRLGEPLVTTREITLVGDGTDRTRILSEAEGAVLVHTGPSPLRLEDLTVAHEGEAPAAVLVLARGPHRLARLLLMGGVVDEDGARGNGLLLAPVERGTAGADTHVVEVEVRDNQGGGIVIGTGRGPVITDTIVRANGTCGLCYADGSAGQVTGTVISSNQVGVLLDGDARPSLRKTHVTANQGAGLLYRQRSGGLFEEGRVAANGEAGIVVTEEASPTIRSTRVAAHEAVGVLVLGRSDPLVFANHLQANGLGIELTQDADPVLEGNRIIDSLEAGVRVGGSAGGTLRGNVLSGPIPVAVAVAEQASPLLEDNRIQTTGEIGLAYLNEGGGAATGNQVSDQHVGVQVGDQARPELTGNVLSGQEEAAMVYTGTSSGRATANTCREVPFGIVLLEEASPELADNDCPVTDQRG